jgi:hypothetical protein
MDIAILTTLMSIYSMHPAAADRQPVSVLASGSRESAISAGGQLR